MAPRQSICEHGHDLSDEANVYTRPSGERNCKICKRENNLKWSRANREKHQASNRKYREGNAEKETERHRRWREENPEQSLISTLNYNARQIGIESNLKPWMLRYYRYSQGQRCFYCGETMLRDDQYCAGLSFLQSTQGKQDSRGVLIDVVEHASGSRGCAVSDLLGAKVIW